MIQPWLVGFSCQGPAFFFNTLSSGNKHMFCLMKRTTKPTLSFLWTVTCSQLMRKITFWVLAASDFIHQRSFTVWLSLPPQTCLLLYHQLPYTHMISPYFSTTRRFGPPFLNSFWGCSIAQTPQRLCRAFFYAFRKLESIENVHGILAGKVQQCSYLNRIFFLVFAWSWQIDNNIAVWIFSSFLTYFCRMQMRFVKAIHIFQSALLNILSK